MSAALFLDYCTSWHAPLLIPPTHYIQVLIHVRPPKPHSIQACVKAADQVPIRTSIFRPNHIVVMCRISAPEQQYLITDDNDYRSIFHHQRRPALIYSRECQWWMTCWGRLHHTLPICLLLLLCLLPPRLFLSNDFFWWWHDCDGDGDVIVVVDGDVIVMVMVTWLWWWWWCEK